MLNIKHVFQGYQLVLLVKSVGEQGRLKLLLIEGADFSYIEYHINAVAHHVTKTYNYVQLIEMRLVCSIYCIQAFNYLHA